MPVAFQAVAAEALSLPPDDQRRLRELLNEHLAECQSPETSEEDALEKDLLSEGLLDQVPAEMHDFTPYRSRTLLPGQGNAASVRLIAERR